ncbi:PREDICTED: zinc finger protein 2-like [Vollenhovia emeryi]|uniref:zinc finger protein 2-like n=1 Tax=Vollenhovia emeryi TaxID=411798 RepID=UPI0005F3D1EA|nr:PREDICTED: zinc finger protein 2-like [Vollenhovia emeryi]
MAAIDLTTNFKTGCHHLPPASTPMSLEHAEPEAPAVPAVPVASVMPVTFGTQNSCIWRSQTRKMYMCPDCGKGLSHRYTLDRHRKTVCGKVRNINGKWKCNFCGRRYESQGSLSRHYRFECRVDPQFRCIFCESKFTQQCSLSRHLKKKHTEKGSIDSGFGSEKSMCISK